MAKVTRRGFIAKSSAGAAAVGALAVAPGLAAAHAAPKAPLAGGSVLLNEALVAHVRDAASGEIAILVGDREVIVRDRELVARLVQAAR